MIIMLHTLQSYIHCLPVLMIVGIMTLSGYYLGRTMRFFRLPSIIGFMLLGVLVGPSFADMLGEELRESLSFIPDIALGFVSLSIGLELSLSELRSQGRGIVAIILLESFFAFVAVTAAVLLLTHNLPLALIFGALAPASAPAGTVAVIQEYKAKGNLTKALYAVVGFDDGLAIVIFGFAFAVSRSLQVGAMGGAKESLWSLIGTPVLEIGLSLGVGAAIAVLYCLLVRKLSDRRDFFILTFATVLISIGVCEVLHLSVILTNLVVGLVAVNTQPASLIARIRNELTEVMPLLFVLFFALAGSNLQVALLPSLGLLGAVYIGGRSAGLLGGAWLGAVVGRAEPKIRKYLGLGILSQAGVAIGLALVVKQELSALGEWGAGVGALVLTTVTATSIIFEIGGPILCKIGLQKAGEIARHEQSGRPGN